MKNVKTKKNYLFIIKTKIIVCFFIILSLNLFVFSSTNIYSTNPKKCSYEQIQKKQILDSLYKKVNDYIITIAPNSKLSAKLLTNKCLEYNIDICFVLAQGQLESHFGTKGMAIYTNSVFNVGTYDNTTILIKYKTANMSIEPYLKLLIEKYLRLDRSIKHLLVEYKNKDGYRYAIAKNYEEQLRIIYYSLKRSTEINELQSTYYTIKSESYYAFNIK